MFVNLRVLCYLSIVVFHAKIVFINVVFIAFDFVLVIYNMFLIVINLFFKLVDRLVSLLDLLLKFFNSFHYFSECLVDIAIVCLRLHNSRQEECGCAHKCYSFHFLVIFVYF